jgi:hypothetical protein
MGQPFPLVVAYDHGLSLAMTRDDRRVSPHRLVDHRGQAGFRVTELNLFHRGTTLYDYCSHIPKSRRLQVISLTQPIDPGRDAQPKSLTGNWISILRHF